MSKIRNATTPSTIKEIAYQIAAVYGEDHMYAAKRLAVEVKNTPALALPDDWTVTRDDGKAFNRQCWKYIDPFRRTVRQAKGRGEAVDTLIDQNLVTVRRQWNDWRTAEYKLCNVDGLHLSDQSGGVNASASQEFIHGYVQCDGMESGELAHSGSHGPCPHQIKVCFVKKDNNKKVFALVSQMASLPFSI